MRPQNITNTVNRLIITSNIISSIENHKLDEEVALMKRYMIAKIFILSGNIIIYI
jgi:hypothetical protein